MAKKYTGRCACNAVQYEFDTTPGFVASCHCLDCKRASGGESATFGGVPEGDFTVTTGTPKSFGYVAASGKKLERVFCGECGARLFTKNLESFPGLVFVTIGTLDDPAAFAPQLDMFTKRRLPWAKPLDGPQFDGMPG